MSEGETQAMPKTHVQPQDRLDVIRGALQVALGQASSMVNENVYEQLMDPVTLKSPPGSTMARVEANIRSALFEVMRIEHENERETDG